MKTSISPARLLALLRPLSSGSGPVLHDPDTRNRRQRRGAGTRPMQLGGVPTRSPGTRAKARWKKLRRARGGAR